MSRDTVGALGRGEQAEEAKRFAPGNEPIHNGAIDGNEVGTNPGEDLKRLAEVLKAKEAAGVIRKIKTAIEHYGLTQADLFGGNEAKTRLIRANGASRKKVGKKSPMPPRFKNDAGNTWSGYGKRPNWYKAAIASGKTPEDLAVGG